MNLTWAHDTGPADISRADQYSVGVGYSMLLTHSTALVVDVVHGQKATRHEDQNLVDVGVVQQFSKEWSLAIGAGAGVAESSPDERVFAAIQRNFELFGGS